MESIGTPQGLYTWIWQSFLQRKVHKDSTKTPQLHMESTKTLWGRVKSSSFTIIYNHLQAIKEGFTML